MARTESSQPRTEQRAAPPTPSIVIPAHNEEQVIGELLAALTSEQWDAEIVVVANGCTDGTAHTARAFPGVQVVETPVASKIRALALGDSHVTRFPRFYVDADVVIGPRDLRELSAALRLKTVHAVGPARELVMGGVGRTVRAYYAVWSRLPGVSTELYGRGVIGVDEVGHRRLAGWREAMSDDLVAAMSFAPHELRVVSTAQVLIRPPRRYGDLLRRRVRAMTGNRQLARDPAAPRARHSGASLGTLARIASTEPGLLPGVLVFLLTALVARLRARWALARGSTAWLRDESSREPAPHDLPHTARGAASAGPSSSSR